MTKLNCRPKVKIFYKKPVKQKIKKSKNDAMLLLIQWLLLTQWFLLTQWLLFYSLTPTINCTYELDSLTPTINCTYELDSLTPTNLIHSHLSKKISVLLVEINISSDKYLPQINICKKIFRKILLASLRELKCGCLGIIRLGSLSRSRSRSRGRGRGRGRSKGRSRSRNKIYFSLFKKYSFKRINSTFEKKFGLLKKFNLLKTIRSFEKNSALTKKIQSLKKILKTTKKPTSTSNDS